MIYTINTLLAELGQRLPLGNGERYRNTVRRTLRLVFRNIGYEKIGEPHTDEFMVRDNKIELPAEVLDVLDVGLQADRMSGERMSLATRSAHALSYFETPTGLEFHHLADGIVYLLYLRLPVNQKGEAVIHEEAYQACLDLCFAVLLTEFPRHPRFPEHPRLKQEAEAMVAQSRAWFNKRGRLAANRVLRKYN